MADQHNLLGGEVVSLDGGEALKIANTNQTPLRLSLFEIVWPPISNSIYSLVGEVKYENVEGNGYLEMWSHFPPAHPGQPEGQYFSRTLGSSGEMGKLTGTSDWRNFCLPFDSTGVSGPPRLAINAFLPGRGTVYVRNVRLVEYPDSAFPVGGAATGWWSSRQGGLIGGIGGSIVGCFGALIGMLAGRGKARRFVLAVTKTLIVCGGVLAIAGGIAVALQQPSDVWYPLMLLGVITAAILGGILRTIQRRFDELEMRRMSSLDAL